MKSYETDPRLIPRLPAIARIDGRAFHSFTKGMKRPFDEVFASCMIDTTIALVKETHACMGYTQSDEITLAWYNPDGQVFFDGRVFKMTSILASYATLVFNRLVAERMPSYVSKRPVFDARVWNVPNLAEGANAFLWRENDAVKNSISMAASAYYSHKELMGKNSNEKQEMLFAKGINWNDYPTHSKRGTYVQHRNIGMRVEDLDSLPPKHHARTNPELVKTRRVVTTIGMPIFSRVTNREAVVFEGQDPVTL